MAPLNDRDCLGAITDTMGSLARDRDPALVALAQEHPTRARLVRWIRSLPQRDDLGVPCDGPKVEACEPPQRLRIAPADPNCFERAAIYVGVAELIDPAPERQLATVDTPAGRHTLPIENGEPVVLDPAFQRNALRAAVFQLATRNGAARVALTPAQAVDWVASLAIEPAVRFQDGPLRVRRGHRALCQVLAGQPVGRHQVRDVVFVLALAEREARAFGRPGRCIVETTARAVDRLDLVAARPRNAAELRLGRVRVRPNVPVLSALARVGGRLGYQVGLAALREKVAGLGLLGPVLSTLEHELNREGMSMGPLASPPPMRGTLAAVTPQAIAGRWLARKL
ncbi:MAG: hypothetical protein H6709_10560 [Kofleriaceae bacterium]|nr:hypothetical protein [Myxococcales bacterium]MCB9564116.1 hypothetical protein [Kofleriaceae bacterium]MCB9572516.1 hypothetical protein [Kofleriaceae bacterium]